MAISEQLRKAIRESGASAYAIAKESGVPQPTITRFLAGADMKASTIDKLAAHFGLELRPVAPVPDKPAKKPKGK